MALPTSLTSSNGLSLDAIEFPTSDLLQMTLCSFPLYPYSFSPFLIFYYIGQDLSSELNINNALLAPYLVSDYVINSFSVTYIFAVNSW